MIHMGVSENSVPHCTQWFCWSLSLLNGYFIGGIPHFQTYPYTIPIITIEFTSSIDGLFVVQDLASRSVSVADLLHFWEKIAEKMPHFDESATTHDVVRQVVIPMSKLGGVFDHEHLRSPQTKIGGFHQNMLIPTGEFLGFLGLCVFFQPDLSCGFANVFLYVSICFYITKIHYIIATPYQSTIIMGDQAIWVLPTHFSWAGAPGGWLIPLVPDATKEGWAAWSLLRLCDDAGRRKLSTTRYLARKGGKAIGMVYGAY